MDKRIIFAVAGSGKPTHIVDSLSLDKRSLIVTYTNSNFDNLSEKVVNKFEGNWPQNVTLMTFFQFLYRFCYKPFLSDKVRARGMIYDPNPNQYAKQSSMNYYMSSDGYFYSNRLSLFLEKTDTIDDIKDRIETYFDELIIDEVQDIAGRDFNFLEHLMDANVNMLFVGDLFQHTYDTSRDGNANQSLFDDSSAYKARFTNKDFTLDTVTLVNSWRCGKNICDFVTRNLNINICSNRDDDDDLNITFVSDPTQIALILNDPHIVKLHYWKSSSFGQGHKNWGDTKGEDCYEDVCVMLNKSTAKKYSQGKLYELPPATRNKLYVAITRAHGNVYLINE